MHFEWDSRKERSNRAKHGISFEDASRLFGASGDCLEIYDEAHSIEEDRFIAVGRIALGVIVVVYTVKEDEVIRILSARKATKAERIRFESRTRREDE